MSEGGVGRWRAGDGQSGGGSSKAAYAVGAVMRAHETAGGTRSHQVQRPSSEGRGAEAAKVRGQVISTVTGQPLARVPVLAEIEGTKTPVGVHATDEAGYVAFLVPHGSGVIRLTAMVGDRVSETVDTGNQTEPRFVLALDGSRDGLGLGRSNALLPSVEAPDAIDARVSPRSFGGLPSPLLGDSGCERLLPSQLPERETVYQKTVRYDDGAAPDEALQQLTAKLRTAAGPAASQEVGFLGISIKPEPLQLGEVLDFRQVWTPLGHGLGEVLYSTSLQPMEAEELAIIDWSREEAFARTEETIASESLTHDLRRERTIDEYVDGALNEDQRGWSSQGGVAASVSGGIGVVGGSISGGYAAGDSTSLGSRDFLGSSAQELMDKTHQASVNMRRLNSTIVVHASQAEKNVVTTRTIRNINRCHSITTLFYSVVRPYVVTTRFVRRRLAVFLPVPFLDFAQADALAYRTTLANALLDPTLAPGFAAMVRLDQADSKGALDPYCDTDDEVRCAPRRLSDQLELLDLWYKEESAAITAKIAATPVPETGWLTFGDPKALAEQVRADALKKELALLDAGYASLRQKVVARALGIELTSPSGTLAPVIAKRFAISLSTGTTGNPNTWGRIAIYLTVDGKDIKIWEKAAHVAGGPPLNEVNFPIEVEAPERIDAREIGSVKLEWDANDINDSWAPTSLSIRYRSARGKEWLGVVNANAGEDGALAKWNILTGGAVFPTVGWRPQSWTASVTPDLPEVPDPRDDVTSRGTRDDARDRTAAPQPGQARRVDDELLARALLTHLNGNAGYYTRAILVRGDPKARVELMEAAAARMRLPGLATILNDEAVGFGGRTVAFATSIELETTEDKIPEPVEGFVVTPTRGIFAETQLSHCDACEERDITKHAWLEDVPDFMPPSIEGITPGPRGATPEIPSPQIPGSILNIAAPPPAPDPAGLAAVMGLLGQGDLFRDMSTSAEVGQLLRGLAGGTVNLEQARLKAAQAIARASEQRKSAESPAQTPVQRVDNIKAAERAAEAASKLNWTPEDTREVTKAIVTGTSGSGSGGEVASTSGVVEGAETRKGLLPATGVTDAQKVDKVLALFGDAPIASAGDANTLFSAIGNGSTYLAWLRSRAAPLGMDRAQGNLQLWRQGDAAGNNVKQFNFRYTPAAEANFTRLWDGIPTMYDPQGTINLIEFLALDLATHIEGYGDYAVVEEAERHGLDYFFEAGPGKRSYNTMAPNMTARDLFASVVFRNAHDALLPVGGTAWNTADAAWAGAIYAATNAPTSVVSDETAFIRQADFYKFRGRGYIQTTNRANYRDLARALRAEIDSIPSPMWGIVSTWPAANAAEAAFDEALTESRDDDWTNLFRSTGGVVPWLGVRTFSRAHSDCIHMAPPTAGSLLGKAAGTVEFLGKEINGYGGALAEAVRKVLLEMYDSLT
jgi:hypothetical protein